MFQRLLNQLKRDCPILLLICAAILSGPHVYHWIYEKGYRDGEQSMKNHLVRVGIAEYDPPPVEDPNHPGVMMRPTYADIRLKGADVQRMQ